MTVDPVCLHSQSYPGNIDGEEGAAFLTGKDAFGFDGLPAPAVKAEDPVGFRDGVPALEIGQLPSIGLPGADMAVIGITLEQARCTCFTEKPPPPYYRCPHTENRFSGFGEGGAPGNLSTPFKIMRPVCAAHRS